MRRNLSGATLQLLRPDFVEVHERDVSFIESPNKHNAPREVVAGIVLSLNGSLSLAAKSALRSGWAQYLNQLEGSRVSTRPSIVC
jgi:hypothetical protein